MNEHDFETVEELERLSATRKSMGESTEEFDRFEQKLDVMGRTQDRWLKNAVGKTNIDPASMQIIKQDVEAYNQGLEELVGELSEEEYAKVLQAKDRGEAILLANSKRTFGDSKEMKQVKADILAIESRITTEQSHPVTADELEEVQQMYMKAISSCETYLGGKNPSTDSGKMRKLLVEKNRNRLIREVQQIAVAKELIACGTIPAEMISVDKLFLVADLYSMVPAATETVSAQKEKMSSTGNKKLLNVLAYFKTNRNTFKDDKAKKDYVEEVGALYRYLCDLPERKVSSVSLELQGEWVLFTKDEDENVTITVDGASMTLSENLQGLIYSLQSKIIEEQDIMNDDLMLDVIWAQGQTKEMINAQMTSFQADTGAMQKSRNLLTRFIELRTKRPAAYFANESIAMLKVLADDIMHGRNVDEALNRMNSFEYELNINNQETLKLVQQVQLHKTETDQKVDYTAVHKETELNGWTEDEAKIRDLIADIIFSEETWEADETLRDPGERIRRVMLKHKEILGILIADSQREDKTRPSMLDQMIDKLPLKAMINAQGSDNETGVDSPDAFKEMLHKCIDDVNAKVDAQIDRTIKERHKLDAFKMFMPEWIANASDEDLKKESDEKRHDAKQIEDAIEFIYSEEVADSGLLYDREDLKVLDVSVDLQIRDTSTKIQSYIDESVNTVFADDGEQETTNEQIIQKAAVIGDFSDVKEFESRAKRQLAEERAADRNARQEDPSIRAKALRKTCRKEGEDYLNKILADAMKGNSGQGKFIKQVFSKYFSGVSLMDRRNMFASSIRNAVPVNEEDDDKVIAGQYLAGMLKGAGPLFQKLLQGLPEEGFPEEIKIALKDMKSKLAPIPETIVKAQLLGMVERSKGKIDKITVTKALGAASVGQTFLCRMYGKDLPEDGKEVVIKLLKPDVRNRMNREKRIMLEAARDTDRGMEATYLGQLERIEEELDLNIEARNVGKGEIYDKSIVEEDDGVRAMKLDELIKPTVNAMALEKAPGETVDRYITELKAKIASVDEILERREDEKTDSTDPYVKRQHDEKYYKRLHSFENEMIVELERVIKRHYYMENLSNKWVTQGIFGEGFYHGDLHAGNIMIDDEKATIIDFGNATDLDEKQQVEVTRMVGAAAVGDAEGFREGLHKLLKPEFEPLYKEKKDELSRVLKAVFTLGDQNSAGQRVAVGLIKAQEMGLEVPSAIFNFSQCQLRLQNAVDGMKKTMEDMREALVKITGTSSVYSTYSIDFYKEYKQSFYTELPPASEAMQVVEKLRGNLKKLKKSNEPLDEEFVKDLIDGKVQGRSFEGVVNKYYKVFSTMGDISKIITPLYIEVIKGRGIDADDLRRKLNDAYVTETSDNGADTIMYFARGQRPQGTKMMNGLSPVCNTYSYAKEIVDTMSSYSEKFKNKELKEDERENLKAEFTAKFNDILKRFDETIASAQVLKTQYTRLQTDKKLTSQQKKEIKDILINEARKLHKTEQQVNNRLGNFTDFMLTPEAEIKDSTKAQMKVEIEEITEFNREDGERIQTKINEINAIKATQGYDIQALRDKIRDLYEDLQSITIKRAEAEMKELDIHEDLKKPKTFVEVMGVSIVSNISKALGRLGWFTSWRYKSKMDEAQKNKVDD